MSVNTVAISTPCEDKGVLLRAVYSPNPIQQLFDQVLATPTTSSVGQLFQKVQEAKLDCRECERFLNSLVAGKIITLKEKTRRLFLHACVVNAPDVAKEAASDAAKDALRKSLTESQLDRQALLLELIEDESSANLIPEPAMQLALQILAESGIWLDGEVATLSNLCTLIDAGVDPSQIVIDSLHPIEWAMRAGLDNLHPIVSQSTITPALLKSEHLKKYFAARFRLASQEVTAALLLKGLAELGASLEEEKEAFFKEACATDDVALAETILDLGLNQEIGPFEIALTSPTEQKVAKLLLAKRVAPLPAEKLVGFLKNVKTATEVLRTLLPQLIERYTEQDLQAVPVQELLFQLTRLQVFDAIDMAIKRGLTLYESTETKRSCFSQEFIRFNQETIVYLLKKHFLDPNSCSQEGTALILLAFIVYPQNSALLAELSKRLTEIDCGEVVTKDKETVLHLLAKLEIAIDVKWISYFVKNDGVDVNALDIHKRPALYYALYPMKPDVVEALLSFGATPFFLADRIVAYVNFVYQTPERQNRILAKIKAVDAAVHQAPQSAGLTCEQRLEFGFLWPMTELVSSLGHIFESKAHYLKELIQLHKKYPQAPKEYFYSFLLLVNPLHLQRKSLDFAIAPCESPIQFAELYSMFDTLNWQNPHAAETYCDPNGVLIGSFTYKKAHLQTAFYTLLIQYIPQRTYWTGTPPNPVERELFYANLQNILKHIATLMHEEQDQKKRRECLLELAWSSMLCGVRWEETALKYFRRLKHKKSADDLLEDEFDVMLADSRENLISELTRGDIHAYRYYLRTIGNEFKIPISKGITQVAETHQPANLNPEICERNFRLIYNASSIVTMARTFFDISLKKNDGMLRNWFSNNIPAHFSFPGYRALGWSIRALDLFVTDPKQKRSALVELFKKVDKEFRPPADFESGYQLLQEKLKEEYLENGFYSLQTFTLHEDGIIDFLQARKVLTETHQGIFSEFLREWQAG